MGIETVAQPDHRREVMPTVLLIEDDAAMSRLVVGVLAKGGFRPVTVSDHDQIGPAVDRWRPKCVLIDGAHLPTGQGRSWNDALAIRRAHPDLPLLMFSADAAALAEARAGSSGRSREARFAGVVGKPFVVEEFLEIVRRAVDRQRPARVATRATDDGILAMTLFPDAGPLPLEDPARAAFFSTVVHELRSPLTAISAHIQLARRSMVRARPEQERVALERALLQVARMERLISELLDESRISAGALTLEVVAFDLCAIVANAVAQSGEADSARLAFVATMPDLRVRGDPFRVAQIVGDLVNNALKYSPAGSRVVVSLRVIGSEAQLRVEDHGVGVPTSEQGRLFEPYFRSTRTRDVSGTGLGLHISRQLAELHGGRLWLEKSTDAGSVFALALPLGV